MKKHLSSLLFLIAAMLWGFAFSAQKAAEALSPFVIGTVRNFIGALFLLLVIPALDKFTKNGRRLLRENRRPDFTVSELIGGAVCGVILAIASVFQQLGISEGTDAGKAAFITALYVVMVPIISLLLKKTAPINVYISVAIAVVGFYFLCIKDDLTLELSDTLVLICALIFALHIIVIDIFSPRCDGVRMSCVQFAVAFVLNGVLMLVFDTPLDLRAIGSALPALLYLGICSSGIAYTLQIVGQRDANPAVASIILSLESVFGVIGGAIVFGEVLSLREYVGCAIVFLAVILSQLDLKVGNKPKKDAKD